MGLLTRTVVIMALSVSVIAACGDAEGDRPWERPGTQAGQEIVGPAGIPLVWVPAGSFMMGSTDGNPDEQPVHEVELSGFWIGKTEVTLAQWRSVMRAIPHSDWQDGDDHPVVGVSWNAANSFCQEVGLQLPTEAQWEYAARGAGNRRYPWGNDWDASRCSWGGHPGPGGDTFPVGNFPSGASWCGALDMAGNVWEWCADWYGEDYYTSSPSRDPAGPRSGECRVFRGGSYADERSDYCLSTFRNWNPPDDLFGFGRNGFRVTCAVSQEGREGTSTATRPRHTEGGNGTEALPREERPWEQPGTEAGQEIVGPAGIPLVWVPAGSFMMGSTDGNPDEQPVHEVELSGFWIGKTEVTLAQWWPVMHEYPPAGLWSWDVRGPMVCVSWYDCIEFCQKVGLGLPTEAQWEYAARGSSSRVFPWGSESDYKRLCWTRNRATNGRALPAGSIPMGASWCGVLDMAGSVGEWCADLYQKDYYTHSPRRDPVGPTSGSSRVVRGGSWNYWIDRCRCAAREGCTPDHRCNYRGLRVARSIGRRDPLESLSVMQAGQAEEHRDQKPEEDAVPDGRPWQRPGAEAGEEIEGPAGIALVWVPGGSFLMGSTDEELADFLTNRVYQWYSPKGDERPAHEIEISGFWIGKTEVTVAQYSSVHPHVPHVGWQAGSDHPVVGLAWHDCVRFCESVGLELPTEAQWEYAARGPESRCYPWGDEWDGDRLCDYGNRGPGLRTFPAGSFPSGASWCGARDMAGNVLEWCADRYAPHYYESSPRRDPTGPETGEAHVLRGGSWDLLAGQPAQCRCAERSGEGPDEAGSHWGFRVVSNVGEGPQGGVPRR